MDVVVKLSEDQLKAISDIKKFLNSKNKMLSIIGNAGCGKTFLMKYLINDLEKIDYPYTLCAPTHRACLVLSNFTKVEVFTLHKLLSLQPILDILTLDFKDLKFRSKSNLNFPTSGVIIIDEASMISDSMFDLLLSKITELDLKIIFIGDDKQLSPVEDNKLSKVFQVDNFVKLTTNHRQQENNSLIPLLLKLRFNHINHFENLENSLVCHNVTKDFIVDILPLFERMLKNQNINEVKLLAFTNKRVQALNNCLRRCLFKDTHEKMFKRYEILTSYENFEFGKYKFWNSMDYVVVEEPQEIVKILPNFGSVLGYSLELYDSVYKTILPIFILSNKNDPKVFIELAKYIEHLRITAITNQYNKTKANFYWRKYFKLMNSFATFQDLSFDGRIIKNKTFDYGYAITVHKS